MASPASAAKIPLPDTPPQEYSEADSEKTLSDDEEGDKATGGAAVEQGFSDPVHSTETVAWQREDVRAEPVEDVAVPAARTEASHPEDDLAAPAEAEVEQEKVAAEEQSDVDVQKKSSSGAVDAGEPIVDPRSAGEGLRKNP